MDGQAVQVPYNLPGISITLVGNSHRVETNFSLVVEFDGNWLGVVKMPPAYKTQTDGICGDYNDDASNDLTTSEGVNVRGDPSSHSKVGNSWQIPDPDKPE